MGKIYKPIQIHWNGSVDGLVGFTRYGANYFRAHAQSVANPNTPEQQLAREKFSVLTKTAVLYQPAYRIGFKSFIGDGKGQRALFSKRNYENLLGSTLGSITFDYTNGICSMGGLRGLDTFAASVTTGTQTVNVVWSDNTGVGNAQATDEVYALIVNSETKESVFAKLAARSAESGSMTYPANWGGDTLYVYGFVSRADESDSSYSKMLGMYAG